MLDIEERSFPIPMYIAEQSYRRLKRGFHSYLDGMTGKHKPPKEQKEIWGKPVNVSDAIKERFNPYFVNS